MFLCYNQSIDWQCLWLGIYCYKPIYKPLVNMIRFSDQSITGNQTTALIQAVDREWLTFDLQWHQYVTLHAQYKLVNQWYCSWFKQSLRSTDETLNRSNRRCAWWTLRGATFAIAVFRWCGRWADVTIADGYGWSPGRYRTWNLRMFVSVSMGIELQNKMQDMVMKIIAILSMTIDQSFSFQVNNRNSCCTCPCLLAGQWVDRRFDFLIAQKCGHGPEVGAWEFEKCDWSDSACVWQCQILHNPGPVLNATIHGSQRNGQVQTWRRSHVIITCLCLKLSILHLVANDNINSLLKLMRICY